jgi:hypothetical protein
MTRLLKKAHMLRCAPIASLRRSYKYASAQPAPSKSKGRFLARRASETFLNSLNQSLPRAYYTFAVSLV